MPPKGSKDFATFFASWTRIEPRCRSRDFARGLEARTADPLWFLARGWQFGEMAAENAGSVVDARVAYHTALLDSAATAKGALAEPTALGTALGLPLEVLVEREPVPWDVRLRVRVGQQFERLTRRTLPGLDASAVIAAYRTAYPLELPSGDDLAKCDADAQRFLELMAGRVIDGQLLLAADGESLATNLPNGLSVTPASAAAVMADLRNWFGRLYSHPSSPTAPEAWVPNRLEYEFSTSASVGEDQKVSLTADSYRNGDLDWHTFTATGLPTEPWPQAAAEQKYRPVRVGFGGMPHPRWWAFENNRTDFGSLNVARPDMAKLALMEFALVYGNDWFIVPLTVPLGSVTNVSSITVTDVFGVETEIYRALSADPDPLARWELFAPTDHNATDVSGAPLLLIPPVIPFREESPALEEVRFLRDEGANMVWAVEHTIRDGLGEPKNGFDAQLERIARRDAATESASATAPPTPPSAPLKYRLATKVPENWIPFIPAEADQAFAAGGPGRPSVRLCRAEMLRNEAAAIPERIPSMTRLLDPNATPALLWLDEEAVAREGARVVLTRQRVRWTDGETYVWWGRKVLVGKGEGRSGLRFDLADEGRSG